MMNTLDGEQQMGVVISILQLREVLFNRPGLRALLKLLSHRADCSKCPQMNDMPSVMRIRS